MIKDLLVLTIFPGAMALAAVTDLLTMTVPNRLALALAALFFLVAPLVGLGWQDIGLHVTLGLAALFAATCLWLGPAAFPYTIYAALIGGALTLLLLFWRGLPLPATLSSQGWLVRLHSPKEGVPYGIALAASGLLVYPDTAFMAALGF